ncbi:helix-turn-helix transcriptional regulator [Halobacterium yunchengense]|uniref:helix-turn-helix transcriptional regulator n=1 Tax=Halobacterium yunchengense TaxID=3108497 RepID=UPI00300A5B48
MTLPVLAGAPVAASPASEQRGVSGSQWQSSNATVESGQSSNATVESGQSSNATVENVSFAGEAADRTSDGQRVLWTGESFEMTVTYQPPDRSSYAVCAWTGDGTTETCTDVHLGDPENQTVVTFEQSSWPSSAKGPQNLTVAVKASEDAEDALASHSREVVVLERNESYDGDSLSNSRELDMNTSVLSADTDQDGLEDGVEVRTYGTDPTDPDTDDDGLRDEQELEVGTDPMDPDSDDDGLQDGRERELGTDPLDADTDGDGLDDARELEVGTNPTDADTDGDGLDDGRELEVGTDPLDADTDGDGLDDAHELEAGTDPTDADTDGDGLSDGTEVALLGTDPTSGTTPFTLVTGVLVSVVVVGLFAGRRVDGLDVEWQTTDAVPLAVPRPSRTTNAGAGDGADSSPEREQEPEGTPDQAHEPVVQPADSWDGAPERPMDPDHETVLSILRDNGGRVRQSEVVEATDWSASKVSRKLSAMEEEDLVSRVTIGRENIVTLHGDEPSSAVDDGQAGPPHGDRRAVAPENDAGSTGGDGQDGTGTDEGG